MDSGGLLTQEYGFASRFLEGDLVEEPESVLLDMFKDVMGGARRQARTRILGEG